MRSVCRSIAVIGLAWWCGTPGGLAKDAAGGEEKRSPPYVQSGIIAPSPGKGQILGFCVSSRGGLVAVTGLKTRYGAGPQRDADGKPPVHRVIWFDAAGREARVVDLDFDATRIASGRDGSVYVAGDGVIALFSADGKEAFRGETPQDVKTDEERAELVRRTREKREALLDSYEKQLERTQDTLEQLELKRAELAAAADDSVGPRLTLEDDGVDDERTGEELQAALEAERRRRARLAATRRQIDRVQHQLQEQQAKTASVRNQDPERMVEMTLQNMRQVRAVAAAPDAVFVVVVESSGYGYAVWRLDDRLQNPEQVLSKLRGCCGQMDVQVIGDHLAIAANTKHRVELCGFDGKPIATVGARATAGDDGAGFGGCCNPMNTSPAPDGTLLTGESNGVVKRFTQEGEFVEIVGRAKVRAGCKNSTIGIEPDGTRLYYLDSTAGRVLVLTKADADDAAEENVFAEIEG